MSNLGDLSKVGVSVWLDDFSRSRITNGDLANKISTQHVVGVTTNPSIFAKAITGGDEYSQAFVDAAARGRSVDEAIFDVITEDVSNALDVFEPIYRSSGGSNGRVSIEVAPELAYKTEETFAAAKTIWERIAKPNLHVKIPATKAGLEAISEAIANGICVNVTLIFSLPRYREVINAYLTGLERAREAGRDLSQIFSVASFFVSRLDVAVDARLDEIGSPEASALKGKAAIANARLAYQVYEEAFSSERAKHLLELGANRQLPLWASTGVKNPAYPDTCYVTELAAPEVVNTMPEVTLNAVQDHGQITGNTIAGTYEESQRIFDQLAALGIDYTEVTERLEQEGVKQFIDAWEQLKLSVQERFYQN